MRRILLAGALVTALVLIAAAAYGAPPPGGTFIDDNGNPHEPDIEAIADKGITTGCNPPTNNRYCPDRSVTRDEMASFFSRAFTIAPSAVDRFADDNGNVHEAQINGIAIAGVTLGCNPPANTNYCPTQTVSRAQMASFLRRQLALPSSGTDFYNDDNGSIHEDDINAVTAAGLAVPCGQGHYCPNSAQPGADPAAAYSRAGATRPGSGHHAGQGRVEQPRLRGAGR